MNSGKMQSDLIRIRDWRSQKNQNLLRFLYFRIKYLLNGECF